MFKDVQRCSKFRFDSKQSAQTLLNVLWVPSAGESTAMIPGSPLGMSHIFGLLQPISLAYSGSTKACMVIYTSFSRTESSDSLKLYGHIHMYGHIVLSLVFRLDHDGPLT